MIHHLQDVLFDDDPQGVEVSQVLLSAKVASENPFCKMSMPTRMCCTPVLVRTVVRWNIHLPANHLLFEYLYTSRSPRIGSRQFQGDSCAAHAPVSPRVPCPTEKAPCTRVRLPSPVRSFLHPSMKLKRNAQHLLLVRSVGLQARHGFLFASRAIPHTPSGASIHTLQVRRR